jgi:hypothetical protein
MLKLRYKFNPLEMFLLFTLSDLLFDNAVAQLVEALRYKPEGRGLDSP